MSYDIAFKVKVEGTDIYVPVGECTANTTWNLRNMITESTGLEWKNEANNGLVKDIIPYIQKGYNELSKFPEKYKKYEAKNGWGTVQGCISFFNNILTDWDNLINDYATQELKDYVTFWIE